jgi:hypothetical protein
MKNHIRTIALALCLLLTGVILGSLLQRVQASIDDASDYAIVFPGDQQDAPMAGRPAPYGQYIVTHNNLGITTTAQLGTVARTNGYAARKVIMCDVGDYSLTANLYARLTSTGNIFTVSTGTVFPTSTRTISPFTEIAPWMSLQLTNWSTSASTSTCGIYVQTP